MEEILVRRCEGIDGNEPSGVQTLCSRAAKQTYMVKNKRRCPSMGGGGRPAGDRCGVDST